MKHISKSKIQKIKALLLAQKNELLARESPPLLEEGGDDVDIAQGLIINEMAEKFSLRDKETLSKISDAIHRIEDGSFGICDNCEENIPEKRLEVLPLCTLCLNCAEYHEKKAKQYRK